MTWSSSRRIVFGDAREMDQNGGKSVESVRVDSDPAGQSARSALVARASSASRATFPLRPNMIRL